MHRTPFMSKGRVRPCMLVCTQVICMPYYRIFQYYHQFNLTKYSTRDRDEYILIPFYQLMKANRRAIANPSLQPLTPANTRRPGCQRLDSVPPAPTLKKKTKKTQPIFLVGCLSCLSFRQASGTSRMKPVAKPEVLCGGPHLVVKSGTAFPTKEDWQVVFNSKAP